MSHVIKHVPTLRKLLWLDAFMGGSTGIAGLILFNRLTDFLGLNAAFILCVSCITLCYAIVAFYLARQQVISIPLLRLLIMGTGYGHLSALAYCSCILLKQPYSEKLS
jgi:hypothetical protein